MIWTLISIGFFILFIYLPKSATYRDILNMNKYDVQAHMIVSVVISIFWPLGILYLIILFFMFIFQKVFPIILEKLVKWYNL